MISLDCTPPNMRRSKPASITRYPGSKNLRRGVDGSAFGDYKVFSVTSLIQAGAGVTEGLRARPIPGIEADRAQEIVARIRGGKDLNEPRNSRSPNLENGDAVLVDRRPVVIRCWMAAFELLGDGLEYTVIHALILSAGSGGPFNPKVATQSCSRALRQAAIEFLRFVRLSPLTA